MHTLSRGFSPCVSGMQHHLIFKKTCLAHALFIVYLFSLCVWHASHAVFKYFLLEWRAGKQVSLSCTLSASCKLSHSKSVCGTHAVEVGTAFVCAILETSEGRAQPYIYSTDRVDCFVSDIQRWPLRQQCSMPSIRAPRCLRGLGGGATQRTWKAICSFLPSAVMPGSGSGWWIPTGEVAFLPVFWCNYC